MDVSEGALIPALHTPNHARERVFIKYLHGDHLCQPLADNLVLDVGHGHPKLAAGSVPDPGHAAVQQLPGTIQLLYRKVT